jgi:hypothetical protein
MRNSIGWTVIVVIAFFVTGTISVRAATSAAAAQNLTFLAFDVNNGGLGMNNDVNDPGYFASPGTNPAVLSQGDQMIVNDQLTRTHKQSGGYQIVGYDSGLCTVTRVPDPQATTGAQKGPHTVENCTVTAVVPGGSLVVEGAIPYQAQQPKPASPAMLAVIGGTGTYDGATGTVTVSFGKTFNTYAIDLR